MINRGILFPPPYSAFLLLQDSATLAKIIWYLKCMKETKPGSAELFYEVVKTYYILSFLIFIAPACFYISIVKTNKNLWHC